MRALHTTPELSFQERRTAVVAEVEMLLELLARP